LPTASRLALPQAGVLIIVGVHQKHTFISFACPKETNQRKGHFSKRIFEHRSKPLQKQCVAAQLKCIVFLLILVEKELPKNTILKTIDFLNKHDFFLLLIFK
jgi:hypothetical protein